jgi:hypothetical protein
MVNFYTNRVVISLSVLRKRTVLEDGRVDHPWVDAVHPDPVGCLLHCQAVYQGVHARFAHAVSRAHGKLKQNQEEIPMIIEEQKTKYIETNLKGPVDSI